MSVRADPAKLRQLAVKLKSTGQQLEQLQRQTLRALQASGWDDRERQRFEADLTREMKTVAAVGRNLQGEYAKNLERKARALDEFHGR
jgi:hypothetical protein